VLDAQHDTTTAPTPLPQALADELNALLLRLAVRDYNAKRALASAAAAKAEAVLALRRGGTQVAADPTQSGQEIAQVTVSKVTYTASVVDRGAAEAWVKDRYPDKVETRLRLLPGATEQDVLNVLRTFAPYLLEEVDVVPDHVLRELELKSQQARRPMGWGGEVDQDAPAGIAVTVSDPRVTVTFRNTEAIDELIVAGVVDMDGNIVARGGAR